MVTCNVSNFCYDKNHLGWLSKCCFLSQAPYLLSLSPDMGSKNLYFVKMSPGRSDLWETWEKVVSGKSMGWEESEDRGIVPGSAAGC